MGKSEVQNPAPGVGVSTTSPATNGVLSTSTAIVPVNPQDPGQRQEQRQEQPTGQDTGALQKFLAEHPEYMRVLQNPTKTLSDPRVKQMFVKDLQNYPAVKTFFESKGLQLT